MSAHKLVVKHMSGESYKIHLPREGMVQAALKPKSFWDEGSARQFINSISVTHEYWKDIINQCGSYGQSQFCGPADIEKEISHLMIRDQLRFYPVQVLDNVEHPPEKRVIKSADNIQYRFEPTSTLLFTNAAETKAFSNVDEAKEFIGTISNDTEKLATVAKELKLNIPTTAKVHPTEINEVLAQSLATGNSVIIIDKTSSVPASKKEDTTDASINNKEAGLGTGSTDKEDKNKEEEKEHVCLLNKMTLTCKHGREAVLDPSKAIDPKSGNAKVPYLSVTSGSINSPRKAQEVLTAKIEVDDKCGGHKKSPYSISSDTIKLVNENFGDVIKFYSPGEELSLTTKFYKYIWLPSIKSISYKVSPPSFCNMSKFDGKGKSIKVNVYPDIKWDLGLEIGFGQIKATDSSPGDKKASSNHIIERKIEQEVFSISGSAKCTHGNDTIDFVSKLNNKFDALKNEISGQNALLSKVFGKFQEGDNHSVTLDLPKLAFKGTSSIAEKNGSPDVDVRWDYNISASPLIGIKAEVDVLPMLIRASGWGSLFLPLLSELKEKYANPDGSIGVQLEASVILSIAGNVSFDLKFSDKSFPQDEKSELRSLKFDVPFECKGELKGKGHLFIFSAELGVLAKLDSGFAYEMFMGADSSGIYRSSILHFHGLVFEIKAYISGKIDASGKNKTKEKKLFKKSKRKTSSSRTKEYNNKWTWIEKGKKEFGKEYIIQN